MKVSLNKKDEVNGIIAIEVEKPDYQEKVEKSLNHFRQKANIPGFRQGKVPKGIINKMYGKAILADEINKIVNEELLKYIRENDLQILGEPLPNETEEKLIDFDKDENFEFKFDIALSPEFTVELNKRNKLTYYNVKLEEDLLDKQMEAYKSNYGTYKQIEEPAKETDLIKGVLTELENGKAKENATALENSILMPSYIKDEDIKNSFIGAKVGDNIVFNPRKAYDNNEAEIASLLQTTKENVKDITADFNFEIKEVTRYEEATVNQELFDKVLGEGAATTEEEFRAKIGEALSNQFKPNADYLFITDARALILEKLKDVKFPDEFLKRWLLAADEKKTAEMVEEDYPKLIEDLKFHIAKDRIAKANDFKIENEDVEKLAEEVAKAQFAQYGMNNIPADVLQNYVKNMLQNEETIRNLYEKVSESKIIDWLKQTVKVEEKEISSKDFAALLNKEQNGK